MSLLDNESLSIDTIHVVQIRVPDLGRHSSVYAHTL